MSLLTRTSEYSVTAVDYSSRKEMRVSMRSCSSTFLTAAVNISWRFPRSSIIASPISSILAWSFPALSSSSCFALCILRCHRYSGSESLGILTQDVVRKFPDQRQIVFGSFCRWPVFTEYIVQHMMQPILYCPVLPFDPPHFLCCQFQVRHHPHFLDIFSHLFVLHRFGLFLGSFFRNVKVSSTAVSLIPNIWCSSLVVIFGLSLISAINLNNLRHAITWVFTDMQLQKDMLYQIPWQPRKILRNQSSGNTCKIDTCDVITNCLVYIFDLSLYFQH